MEVYRNDQANVDLLVPVEANGAVSANAYDGSTALYTFTVTSLPDSAGYRVTLPFSLVANDSEFVVRWEFDYTENSQTKHYTSETSIKVLTPYVTKEELSEAIPEVTVSDAAFVRLERKIRGVIDTFTGQSFGRYKGMRQVVGAGDNQLKLSERLASMETLDGHNILEVSGLYTVRGDGWYIGVSNPTPDGDFVFDNVIRDPDSYWSRKGFPDNMVYSVYGVWGYLEVPSMVKEAALILMEDELCPQSEYRDRYLKSISGDGWRYEFNPNAYYGTGSVIADQILEPYRRSQMTVI